MTLQQQVVREAGLLSDGDLTQVIRFIGFLRFSKSAKSSANRHQIDKKKYRTREGLSGEVVLTDDFNESPFS